MTRAKLGIIAGLSLPFAVQHDGCGHRVEHVLIAKRLDEKIDGAGFHRTDAHRNVAMPAHQDCRQVDSELIETILEIQPVHPGHANVEDQAARHVRALGGEKLLDRGMAVASEADRSEQAQQGHAQRLIVIDHMDDGIAGHFLGLSAPPIVRNGSRLIPSG